MSSSGSMKNSTWSASVMMRCMTSVRVPAAPVDMMTFSVSGRLHTQIMVPSSSKMPASRMVNPPASAGIIIFTSMMFGLSSLIHFAAMDPRQTSCLSSVMSSVGT